MPVPSLFTTCHDVNTHHMSGSKWTKKKKTSLQGSTKLRGETLQGRSSKIPFRPKCPKSCPAAAMSSQNLGSNWEVVEPCATHRCWLLLLVVAVVCVQLVVSVRVFYSKTDWTSKVTELVKVWEFPYPKDFSLFSLKFPKSLTIIARQNSCTTWWSPWAEMRNPGTTRCISYLFACVLTQALHVDQVPVLLDFDHESNLRILQGHMRCSFCSPFPKNHTIFPFPNIHLNISPIHK